MEPMQKRILITLIVGIVLVIAFYFITDSITKYTGFSVSGDDALKDDFIKCLKEQDITLYINTNDISKTLSEIELFDYLQYFKIKNCINNNQECVNKGVNSFPAWIVNNQAISKDINFNELSEYSRCKPITKQ
ncbi:MAG: hypothetical protein PHH54_06540 [Candidatus Nanoarchaeia archaeon]|nr:hypothetical protein [Candidatus Nanoarchaeia archaeon]MDD5741614.1 hypothetical protein [Candidatus Nanoarchaeia archaeon]